MEQVILVHGLLNTAGSLRKMARFLEDRGFRTHLPRLKPSTGQKGIDELAAKLKAYIDENFAQDEVFNLVGFSMGGLVCRYYIQRLNGLGRVHRFVSLSTPHYGSWLAYAIPNNGCRQMRPRSPFLEELNRDVHILKGKHIASLWTPFDLMVLPARNSILAIGGELKLLVPIHRLMISNRKSINAVAELLQNGEIGNI